MTVAGDPGPLPLPAVELRPGNRGRLLRGHPWVYASEIARTVGDPRDGALVEVRDPRRRPFGCGFYNSRSRIAVRRLTTRDTVEPTTEWFVERIAAAWDWRQRRLADPRCCRVVNSESDFLPGLILDRYDDRWVFQTLTRGMDERRSSILEAVEHLFAPRTIVERNDAPVRRIEGLAPSRSILRGTPEQARTVLELDGLQLDVDLLEGHKGGLYLDQRANRLRIAALADGRRVLDAFSYRGEFALHCARQGATAVTAVEIAQLLADAIRDNARRNSLDDRLRVVSANAFDFLKQADAERADGEAPFDLIVLDPPSFTRRRSTVREARRGYKEINLRACRLLAPGGLLATFCCSHHVDRGLFQEILVEAAADARRTLRRVDELTQGLDHPVLPAVPETEYLKGFVFELVG